VGSGSGVGVGVGVGAGARLAGAEGGTHWAEGRDIRGGVGGRRERSDRRQKGLDMKECVRRRKRGEGTETDSRIVVVCKAEAVSPCEGVRSPYRNSMQSYCDGQVGAGIADGAASNLISGIWEAAQTAGESRLFGLAPCPLHGPRHSKEQGPRKRSFQEGSCQLPRFPVPACPWPAPAPVRAALGVEKATEDDLIIFRARLAGMIILEIEDPLV
jgi:hypothetical protein